MNRPTPAIELVNVTKDYRALRPLRVRELTVHQGEIVAVGGFDVHGAEVLTGLITGAIVPDEGRVALLGQDTATIASADQWLAALDRVGVMSDRVALLDGFTVAQNIAVPLTLDLDPLPPGILAEVLRIARNVGLDEAGLHVAAGAVDAPARARVRLARAIAPGPAVLIVEHPTASLPASDGPGLMRELIRIVRGRRLACLIVVADSRLARGADRQLVLDPRSGTLSRRGLGGWFS